MNKMSLSLLCLVALTGCFTDQKANRLNETLHHYDSAIRWGKFSMAQQMQKEPAADLDFQRLRDIKVMSIKPLQEIESEDGQELVRTVEIGYFFDDVGRVKTLTDKQIWRYDPETEVWRMEGEIPDFQ